MNSQIRHQQEQIVIERSVRLIWIRAKVTMVKGVMDDHLQEDGPSGWLFARGWSIRMIICKRPVPSDDHLQEAS